MYCLDQLRVWHESAKGEKIDAADEDAQKARDLKHQFKFSAQCLDDVTFNVFAHFVATVPVNSPYFFVEIDINWEEFFLSKDDQDEIEYIHRGR